MSPLDPMPMTAAEIADLIRRVRINMTIRPKYVSERIQLAIARVKRGVPKATAARLEGCSYSGLRSALKRKRRRR